MKQKTRLGSVRTKLGAAGGAAGLLLGTVLLCVPACSTLDTLSTGEKWLYSGTRANIEALKPDAPHEYLNIRALWAEWDFPCSLVLDTVLIPITLPLQLIVGDKPKPAPPTQPQ